MRWDAITGRESAAPPWRVGAEGTTLPLAFEPWESAFFLFVPDEAADALPRPAAAIETAPPAVAPLEGVWEMTLEGHAFETFRTKVPALVSWTDMARTRHFSGTGRYEMDFDVPAERLASARRVILDLGRVGNIAEVELNGRSVGVAWMAPHRLDVTAAARAGRNRLVVLVTNTLINRVTGLVEPPDVPSELEPRLGRAAPAIHPHSGLARREMSETELPPSGLLGPVTLRFHFSQNSC
jgi:hypothetical protein